MKVVVESINNQIVSDYCFKGWLGATNLDHDVELMSLSKASMLQKELKEKKPMPIGSVEYMEYFFNLYGIEKPTPLNIHRHIPNVHENWKELKGRSNIKYPTFVKPLYEVKKFTGFVAKSEKDFELYPELENWGEWYLTIDPFNGNILSEWRVFVYKGKIINISCYSGNSLPFPSSATIHFLIQDYEKTGKAPIAYSLDFAEVENIELLEISTIFVEANDMWAIGPYGCKEEDYFIMLKDRWNEIIRQ